MYAQVTVIRVPQDKMAELRKVIQDRYLPAVRMRPGFRAAYFLEQTDDSTSAELIQFWDSQADVENFHRTGDPEASMQGIVATIPGARVRRDGFLVQAAVRNVHQAV
jgi:heme-degrading monooxygenase HmoA